MIIPQTVKLTPDYIALNRAMFGATAKELERVGKTGSKAWIKEQIHPDDAIAKEGSKRIGSHCMRIKYEFEAVRAPGTHHRERTGDRHAGTLFAMESSAS